MEKEYSFDFQDHSDIKEEDLIKCLKVFNKSVITLDRKEDVDISACAFRSTVSVLGQEDIDYVMKITDKICDVYFHTDSIGSSMGAMGMATEKSGKSISNKVIVPLAKSKYSHYKI
jgi:hypothetical protein